MNLRLLAFDNALEEANQRYFSASDAMRKAWRQLEMAMWLYGEMQLEGHPLTLDDMERAFQNAPARDYCDGVRLEQIRRMNTVLKDLREQALEGKALSLSMLCQWQRDISGEKDAVFRRTEGATEHYKHDTVPVDTVLSRTEAALMVANQHTEKNVHTVRAALDLLFELGRVWPFETWSGSIARLAASHVLIRGGYPPIQISPKNRRRFYQAYHYDPLRMDEVVFESLESQLSRQIDFLEERVGIDHFWTSLGADPS